MLKEYSDKNWDFKECSTEKEKKMHVVLFHIALWNYDYLMYLQNEQQKHEDILNDI